MNCGGGDLRWGVHAAEAALRAGRVRRLVVQQDLRHRPRLADLVALARAAGVALRFAGAGWLDARAGTTRHQGVVAEVAPYRYRSVPDLLALARDEPPFLLALDGVEDPQNLGAILRSADAAGVHGVLVRRRRAAPITAAAARASAGAADHVAVAQVVNLARTLERLKGSGIWIYGLDAAGAEAFDRADYHRPVAIVAGAEGKGLSRLVREGCDLLLRIPLRGHVESLNVAVAASLALFAARRGRDRPPS